MTRFIVRSSLRTSLLLLCLLAAGCAPTALEQARDRQQFETVMNGMVGRTTYDQVLLNFGPPSHKEEAASAITAVWESPSAGGEGLRLVFDRRTLKLKSWSYLPR